VPRRFQLRRPAGPPTARKPATRAFKETPSVHAERQAGSRPSRRSAVQGPSNDGGRRRSGRGKPAPNKLEGRGRHRPADDRGAHDQASRTRTRAAPTATTRRPVRTPSAGAACSLSSSSRTSSDLRASARRAAARPSADLSAALGWPAGPGPESHFVTAHRASAKPLPGNGLFILWKLLSYSEGMARSRDRRRLASGALSLARAAGDFSGRGDPAAALRAGGRPTS